MTIGEALRQRLTDCRQLSSASSRSTSSWPARPPRVEQGAVLLDQTRLEDGPAFSDNIFALELVAWMRVTAVLEDAAARPDRDALDATLDDASRLLGVELNLLTAARVIERALVRQRGATAEALTAGLRQRPRSGPPSALFRARPLREYGTAVTREA